MSKDNSNRTLIAVIGDEDSVTGMLLAGIGETHAESGSRNFFTVDAHTEDNAIAEAFEKFTKKRTDIAILLINQNVSERIRPIVDAYDAAFPAILEIPSKDHPYDPEKDSVMKRVRRIFGDA